MSEEIVTETEEQAPETKQEHRADQTTISEYLESLLVTVILALFGTSFIVQAFKIPSASMEGTLLIGDHLLVNKFIFGGTGAWYEKVLPYRQLQRGDIIVFKYPYADHQHFVKRVIGICRPVQLFVSSCAGTDDVSQCDPRMETGDSQICSGR